jgi:hypothetical protein
MPEGYSGNAQMRECTDARVRECEKCKDAEMRECGRQEWTLRCRGQEAPPAT